MKTMIRNMTCEDATLLIRTASESLPPKQIDENLRNYILGNPASLSSEELIFKLQDWKNKLSCSLSSPAKICVVIDKALVNLK